jgi:hypothetical protein
MWGDPVFSGKSKKTIFFRHFPHFEISKNGMSPKMVKKGVLEESTGILFFGEIPQFHG